MAMLETILATVSGLGGAGLGAAGAILVQRAKRRDDAEAAQAAAARAERDLTLEIVATARAAARGWLTITRRVIADLSAARTVNFDMYEEQETQRYTELTSALYRLAGQPEEFQPTRGDSPPLASQVEEASQLVRDLVHRAIQTPTATDEVAEVHSAVDAAFANVNDYLVKSTELATDRDVSPEFRAKMASPDRPNRSDPYPIGLGWRVSCLTAALLILGLSAAGAYYIVSTLLM
ncbi:hypothetical protein ACFY8W_36270 [Streptomyces sp. NPDC012637]|uniref:hypothetical protein n=1 Tax=Streptomyces sp. NPDC012637 TaxID=3364842 RepID=UPI0036E03CA0